MFDARRQLRLTTWLPLLFCACLITACGSDSGSSDADGTETPAETTETLPTDGLPFAMSDLSAAGTAFRIERGITPAATPYGGTAFLSRESPESVIHATWQTEPHLDDFAAWDGPGLPCTHDGEKRLCVARSPVDLAGESSPAGVVIYTRQDAGGLQASWYRSSLLKDGRPGGGSAVRNGDGDGFAGTYCITYTDADGNAFPSMQLVVNRVDSPLAGPAQFALEWWTVQPHDGVCGERTSNAPALLGVGMKLDDQHLTSAWGDIDMQLHILAYRFKAGLEAEWQGKNDDGLGTEHLLLTTAP